MPFGESYAQNKADMKVKKKKKADWNILLLLFASTCDSVAATTQMCLWKRNKEKKRSVKAVLSQ